MYRLLLFLHYSLPFYQYSCTFHITSAPYTPTQEPRYRNKNSETMADAGNNSGNHSSGEYSGVVKEASVGMSRKATDLAITLSSGESTRLDRARRNAEKEAAAKAEMEEEAKAEREKEASEGNKNK